jgi:uncharacterized membrane protein
MSECKSNIKNEDRQFANFFQARRLYLTLLISFFMLIPFFIRLQTTIINSAIKLISRNIRSNAYRFFLQNNTDIWFLCKNNLSN